MFLGRCEPEGCSVPHLPRWGAKIGKFATLPPPEAKKDTQANRVDKVGKREHAKRDGLLRSGGLYSPEGVANPPLASVLK